jgi:hypothetical protein
VEAKVLGEQWCGSFLNERAKVTFCAQNTKEVARTEMDLSGLGPTVVGSVLNVADRIALEAWVQIGTPRTGGSRRPVKALKMARSPEGSKLERAEVIEMRIVAVGARRDMNQLDAADITLTCEELKTENADWSVRL